MASNHGQGARRPSVGAGEGAAAGERPGGEAGRQAAVVLLAAGESTRMERPKQLLPWGGVTLLEYQLRQIRTLKGVGEIAVVLGHQATALRPLVRESSGPPVVKVVVNPEYAAGKTTSIKAGLRGIAGAPRAVAILAVDQPRPAQVLERLLAAHFSGTAAITVPAHQGKHGHPAVFSWSLRDELLAISEEREGLREVMERHRSEVRAVELGDPIVLANLNTEEDYRAALKQFAQGYTEATS